MARAKMAFESQTYPVWVGNLKETVSGKDLKSIFSQHGQIASCKVMENSMGNSRGFGFVNFYTELEAERAASAKQGFKIFGAAIKTKGPNQLKLEGHFTLSPSKPDGHFLPGLNYRPLTDCSYFMAGNKCTRGENCPYRHSETARSSTLTCRQWKERNCLDLTCPYRHPGGKEKKTDLTPGSEEVVTSSGFELLKCGGRCGNASCAAHFASKEDLSQHVKLVQLLQCRRCRAIFFTDMEFQEHKKSCGSCINSGSTDVSSDSPDIEEVSDSGSNDSKSDEDDPVNKFSSRSPSSKVPSNLKHSNLIDKNEPANVLQVLPSIKLSRDQKSSENGTKVKGEPALSKLSSPPNDEHFGKAVYPVTDKFERAYYDDRIVEYSSTSDSDDSDEDEGDDDDYSPSEMAKLLSLNDQDMYEGEEEGGGEDREQGVEEETEARGGYGREALGWSEGISKESKKEHKTTKHNGATTKEEVKSSLAGAVKARQRVKLEPVGVFWDIENCRVPPNKSAFALAAKMRRVFFEGKREAEFMCVCDVTKERKEVIEALSKAQVNVMHVNAIAKNAADDKLRQSLRRFAHTYPAPSTVVLISGDINFSSELTDLRHIHNITIILVHNPSASEGLKVFAHTLINYNEFIQDVEPPQKPPQETNIQRVVVVSGLPTHISASRISGRLNQISDNCGGKVLGVDPRTGTARIRFRTHELAAKALKRMNGKDAFGSKIFTSLEALPPSHGQKYSPPTSGNLGPQRSPPVSPSYPHTNPHHPGAPHQSQFYPPHFGPHPPRIPVQPPIRPLLSPPHQGRSNRFLPIRPGVPPTTLPVPPTCHPPVPFPLHSAPPSQIRGPQGNVLIFGIPVLPRGSLEQLNGQVVGVQLEACVKAEHVILWHNFNELQILLRVDMLQTATIMKEDIIRTLCEKKKLRKELADTFLERCAESIHRVSKAQQLPWEVKVCGWSLDDEEERVVRSKVVALLRQFTPTYWTKWDTFKRKYYEMYSSAISEMAIHNACRGAVQILGNPGNSQHQVIIFYELSPLLKVINDPSLHRQLQKNFIKLLSTKPHRRIKLLDFVRVYRESNIGPGSLPMSFSGKLLQELISMTPNVTMVGAKPSTIYVTLGYKDI